MPGKMWIENLKQNGLLPPFGRIDLPPLTVIVGLNGAGKSQLLRAISTGQIKSPYSSRRQGRGVHEAVPGVTLLTNIDPYPSGVTTDLTTDISQTLSSKPSAPEASKLVREITNLQEFERNQIGNIFHRATGLSLEEAGVSWSMLQSHAQRLSTPKLDELKISEDFRTYLNISAQRIYDLIHENLTHTTSRHGTMTKMPAQWLAADDKEIAELFGWTAHQLFDPSITAIFKEYRDRRWRNQLQRSTDVDAGTELALSTEAFVDTFGIPPWERVTKALEAFGLPYRVVSASWDVMQPVSFQLEHVTSGTSLRFADLSTGEQVLLRLVLATFQADDSRINVVNPELILLDELDASLHPENVQRWLSALTEGFVSKLGSCCILTTHSPTTVALAPEESIFEMSLDAPFPKPISKQRALDRLTSGLPMLSIDYSARRQVFTESNIDVKHYEMLHDLMRARLSLDRTLSFVGTGTQGGCVFVYEMVGHMADNGSRSVFGIVDWDLRNEPTDRVKVLAHYTHYAKENVLLDPLLIGALLLKNDEITLSPPLRFSEVSSADSDTLQRLSDAVIAKIAWPSTADLEQTTNRYWGGAAISLPRHYQRWRGHDLEAALKVAFPMLARHRSEGELATAIIKRVLGELPSLCPLPITELLTSLANDEPEGSRSRGSVSE